MKLTNNTDSTRDYPSVGVFGLEPGKSVHLDDDPKTRDSKPKPRDPKPKARKTQPQDQHDQADKAETPEES